MRIIAALLRSMWNHWAAAPLVACCPTCCINWAGFR